MLTYLLLGKLTACVGTVKVFKSLSAFYSSPLVFLVHTKFV